ncbi:L-histidine N(alpha)-methyltransferase, partial [Staphylococcus aureus]|nr:L-histidine N(alpha)-methyltransferase [Staphylococcus aureus]
MCPELVAHVGKGRAVVEFGSGSSTKTPVLLRCVEPSAYVPIDISGDFLRESARNLQQAFPDLPIHPLEGDFMHPLTLPAMVADAPKLGFFPGSTIGNMTPAMATDLLRAAQIPFALDPATGGITVPEKNLHDARLKLAGSGLTDSGKLGFELMERDPGFGVSQFVESARDQHALETELSRTINTLRPVRDSRVHLAIPKPSAFTRQR